MRSSFPVAQNLHVRLQPTCDDTHQRIAMHLATEVKIVAIRPPILLRLAPAGVCCPRAGADVASLVFAGRSRRLGCRSLVQWLSTSGHIERNGSQVGHPDLAVGWPQPDRYVGPQAGCAK